MNLRKPDWLKIKLPKGKNYQKMKELLAQYNLHTVCSEARCPNLGECWSRKTATFMILGDVCTRSCKFCAVKKGNPKGKVDNEESERIARAVKELGLNYVVITSVTRDDLADVGAEVFKNTISSIRQISPDTKIEVLIPDFAGKISSLAEVLSAQPYITGHNLETVERLTPKIRDKRAGYQISLEVLRSVKSLNKEIKTKSGFMVGLGETENEVLQTMKDLKKSKVDFLTIGQYLQPTGNNLPVSEYIRPEQFETFQKYGLELGFSRVLSSPLVRSSYSAELLTATDYR
ncbi:MAG: lipoyl synthase [candidate division WOR-3 bacterium]|nr:lipoyl synthase [candidate division WOR-3 bacterium]